MRGFAFLPHTTSSESASYFTRTAQLLAGGLRAHEPCVVSGQWRGLPRGSVLGKEKEMKCRNKEQGGG